MAAVDPPAPQKVIIAVCGEAGAGKTTMVHQLLNHEFTATRPATLGVDVAFWRRAEDVVVEIRDISGQDSASVNNATYFRGVQAAAIVCDATKAESVTAGLLWYAEAQNRVRLPNGEQLPLVMAFNKMDLIKDRDEAIRRYTKMAKEMVPRAEVHFTTAHSHDDMVALFEAVYAIRAPAVEPVVARIRLQQTGQRKEKSCPC